MNGILKTALLYLIFTLLIILPIQAQGLPTALPSEVGLCPERLDRIKTVMEKAIEDEQIAGSVTLIARHGKTAYYEAFGMMDIEENKPMRKDAIFRIASMSKGITSTAVMMLYEEGHFLLNDPVSKYIPEFKNPKVLVKNPAGDKEPYKLVPAKSEITIRQLLTHTSGIDYLFNETEYFADIYKEAGIFDGLTQIEGTIGDMVKKLAKLPLLFHPGEGHNYSLSVDVLGYFVEVISGKTLDEFFRERILNPLKMNDTHFFIPDEKLPRLASVYMVNKDGGLDKMPDEPVVVGHKIYSSTYPYKSTRTYYSGGAGLVSTASDYARFLQMIMNGGELDGVRLLSPTTVKFMTVGFRKRAAIGIGIKTDHYKNDELGDGTIGALGWGGFFYTDSRGDPQEDIICIFMSQLYPATGRDIKAKFRNLTFQAIVK